MRRLKIVAGLVALAMCVWPRAAFGQTSANGSIRGYVRDATGAVLPDTTITAAGPGAPTSFTVVSDKEGYYRLLELPPGEYVIHHHAALGHFRRKDQQIPVETHPADLIAADPGRIQSALHVVHDHVT